MDAVALRGRDGWIAQFSVMLGLSVLVAVMGLSADSAAVVIGAMLLAPLMVPVMAIAAAISMALPRHLLRAAAIVAVASLASVLLAFLVAMILPDGQLPGEVLSRTSPDLRDLLVALAAGAAGAYATVRSDVSSALPGVAVAVALVPPLAAVGLTLEGGRADLAEGAALLYVANLTAIVLVGVLVFLLTGFVPPRRLRQTGATSVRRGDPRDCRHDRGRGAAHLGECGRGTRGAGARTPPRRRDELAPRDRRRSRRRAEERRSRARQGVGTDPSTGNR